MNLQFPEHRRSWHSCKSMSQRLYLSPSTSSTTSKGILESGCSYLPSYADAGTHTTLTLTADTTGVDRKEGEWVFMEPRKVLKENAGIGANTLNREALKRLRCFPEDIKSTERARLINLLCHGSCREVARAILSSSLYEKIKTLILYDIEMDARECSNEGSVLFKSQYGDLKTFKWSHIVNELVNRQSFLAEVLLAVSLLTGKIGNTKTTEELVPVLGTVYGILMKQRFHKLAAVQKVVALTLANEQTHQKVYDRLQPLGVSLSHSSRPETMSAIAQNFNSELIDSVKAGKKFRIVGDNINFHLGVAQERKSVGKTEHCFGSAAVVQNISFRELSDLTPQMDLRNTPVERFLISEPEWSTIIFDLSSLAAKVLVEFFPWLNFARSAVHECMKNTPDGMQEESKVIPLPILHKNEQKYSEVVDILDSYQEMCEGDYQAAEEPLPKIHIGGDLLTRERFSGAKKLRAAALTESERLCSLNPTTSKLFHCKWLF